MSGSVLYGRQMEGVVKDEKQPAVEGSSGGLREGRVENVRGWEAASRGKEVYGVEVIGV